MSVLQIDSNTRTQDAFIQKCSDLLSVMGNRWRMEILELLQNGEMSVGVIQEHLPLSQSALSQHLAILRASNLVSTRRNGQTIYYSLDSPAAASILEALRSIFLGG